MNKNSQIALNIVAIAVGMFGLAYASVPLYDLFCKVTGFGGATVEAKAFPDKVYDREIDVVFNSDINPYLNWEFKPVQAKMKVRVGEPALAFYEATNLGDEASVGTSTYNLTPYKVSPYFNKVECFCFEQQRIEAGQKIQFPVSFFIDPEILNDKTADEVNSVVLSYTFFPYKD